MHFVTADLDHGPIIAQAVVPVLPGDSEETLAARVLAREHVLYPRAVRWFVDDLLRVEGSAVRHVRGEPGSCCSPDAPQRPARTRHRTAAPRAAVQAPADGVVSDFFRQHKALGSRERHTLAETTYTVLRQRLLFQHLAQSGKGEMERRLAILGWQGNEGFLRAACRD